MDMRFYPLNHLTGPRIISVVLIELFVMGGTILWAWVLDCVKRRKLAR